MVLGGSPDPPPAHPLPPGDPAAVIWHDLECGSYRADLPLWRELAELSARRSGPCTILDVGAGSGRVALDLARAGHRVIALDVDPGLLAALQARAGGLELQTVHADARSFALGRQDLGLCLAPMQTVQLLGGSDARVAFLRSARAHLRPGALLACAIVTALEPFDCAEGEPGPSPEAVRVEGVLYVSRARAVRVRERKILLERERRILFPHAHTCAPATADRGVVAAREIVELDRVSSSELEREGVQAGLQPIPARAVAATADHVGSTVVMFRA